MKTTQQSKVLFMAQAAMIAAIYVVLTMLGASFAFGEVQIRFSEALTILPAITPAGIPGVFLGCLISNILGGAILPDIIFGSIATLIGALFTWQQIFSAGSSDHRKRAHRSVYFKIRLCSSSSDPVYDADSRSGGSDLLRSSRNDTVHSTE